MFSSLISRQPRVDHMVRLVEHISNEATADLTDIEYQFLMADVFIGFYVASAGYKYIANIARYPTEYVDKGFVQLRKAKAVLRAAMLTEAHPSVNIENDIFENYWKVFEQCRFDLTLMDNMIVAVRIIDLAEKNRILLHHHNGSAQAFDNIRAFTNIGIDAARSLPDFVKNDQCRVAAHELVLLVDDWKAVLFNASNSDPSINYISLRNARHDHHARTIANA